MKRKGKKKKLRTGRTCRQQEAGGARRRERSPAAVVATCRPITYEVAADEYIQTGRAERTNERTNGLLRQRPETNGQSDTEAPRRWGERGHARRQRSRTRPPVSTGSGSDSRFGGACVRGRRRDSARSLPFPAGGVHLLGAARWFIQFATCPVS